MNHADRQRLSQLLDEIGRIMEHETIYNRVGFVDAYSEARAIVDQPSAIITFTGPISPEKAEEVKRRFQEAPNVALDSFLSEPIHEYRDRVPARRRHRALSPLRLATILTLAAVALVCLTASSQTWGGTDRPQADSGPREAPPGAGQSMYRPGHQTGTYGNGRGVLP